MEKICRGCGKPFERKYNAQKFCFYECQYNYNQKIDGKSHHTKPDGSVYHGICLYCGKAFEANRKRKYCSDEHGYQHTLDKAKAERLKAKPLCQQCGKQLPLKRTTFCSDACQKLSEKKTDIVWMPLTDETVHQRIAKRYDHIEHISGHSSGGVLTVRCKMCGGEFQTTEQCSRKTMKLSCPHCVETEKQFEKETTEHNRLINRLIFLLEKRQKSLRDTENRTKRCVICGKEFIPQHGRMLACSEICTQKQKNLAKKQSRHTRKVRKKCNGEIDHSISLEKLIMRDKNTCHICGHRCDSRDFVIDINGNYITGGNHPSIDHVMPLSKGGSHTWGNIKLAHHRCNSQKSDMLCYEKTNGQMALAI